jgi:acyl-CoA thioesterase FadM
MYPLKLRNEIDAHIADRFLEAVWREALWLVKDGIATTEEIDEAIRMGFGLRWAQMGLFETYRIAGGEAGMRHFLAQFGPALKWPWTKLMDVPEFDDELVDLIAGQSDAQSGHRTIRELERLRDDNLVGILRVLKRTGSGAGGVIVAHEVSYFTAENHIRYLAEIDIGDRITVTTQALGGDGRKLHLLHRFWTGGEGPAATVETLLLHVDLSTRRVMAPEGVVAERAVAMVSAHTGHERPDRLVLNQPRA